MLDTRIRYRPNGVEEPVSDVDKVIPEDDSPELIEELQNVDKHVPMVYDHERMEATLRDMICNQFRNTEEIRLPFGIQSKRTIWRKSDCMRKSRQRMPDDKSHKLLIFYDEAVTIVVDEEIRAAAADKPKSKKKKRRVVGASGSDHPPKKLKEDHGTSGDAGASIGGKSLAALQGLLDHSTLAVEVGVTAAATVSFVTCSVTPTLEREGDGNTDYVSGMNLRTQRPSKRFVISC
ncbi:hypothetical protein Tco_0484859 [Tanacetum coccineum]